MKRWLIALVAILVLAANVVAKEKADEEDKEDSGKASELVGKLGIGFNAQTIGLWIGSENAFFPYSAGISVRYYFTDMIGFEGSLGFGWYEFDTESNRRGGEESEDVSYSAISLEPKILFNFLSEEQACLYAFGGLGFVHYRVDYDGEDDTETGIRLSIGAGAQWFFEGLPNLGFSAEFGVMYEAIEDVQFFGTFGGMLTSFGIHYYFSL